MITETELLAADAVCMDPDDFKALRYMRQQLHDRQTSMTFDEQRDFAERMRLLLERAVVMTFPGRDE